jgi:predicted O-methyltransferase YrrM
MKFPTDFNRNNVEGQMYQIERKALYDSVIEKKPKNILEIGTWKGGGSTYYLSAAAYEYDGFLFTIEPDPSFYNYALRLYQQDPLKELRNRICFLFGESHQIIPNLLSLGTFDYIFFDGKEDPDQTIREFNMLAPCIKPGLTIAMHDIKVSKMQKLLPILAQDPTWVKKCEITHTETGFAIYEKV